MIQIDSGWFTILQAGVRRFYGQLETILLLRVVGHNYFSPLLKVTYNFLRIFSDTFLSTYMKCHAKKMRQNDSEGKYDRQ